MPKLRLEILKPNFTKVTLGPLAVWFSYTTPISFSIADSAPCTRVSEWSNTTGRHRQHRLRINACDGGTAAALAARVPGPVFKACLDAALDGLPAPDESVNEKLREALDAMYDATTGLMDLYEDRSRLDAYGVDLAAMSKARDMARDALA